MTDTPDFSAKKLRLRFPNGFEFEALGSEDFIKEQLKAFLNQESGPERLSKPQKESPEDARAENQNSPIIVEWGKIAEISGENLLLRSKIEPFGQETEACLILIAASKNLTNNPKPSALQLARWLRKSGYPIPRIDRVLQNAVQNGEILISGSRRGRKYELSPAGKVKALLIAEKLTRRITPTPKT